MVKASKKLISEVMEIARQELGNSGMRKRGQGEIYTCELNQETIGWVGLNRAVGHRDGLLEINPIMGVRHQPLERMLADIVGEKFHPCIPPSIGVHLGYLMPQKEYIPWLFADDGGNGIRVKKMVAAIIEYGRPFMEANTTLDALCETMAHSGFGVPHQIAYRLPVAYLMLGQTSVVEGFLRSQLAEIGDRKDPAAQDYREFATRLFRLLQNDSTEEHQSKRKALEAILRADEQPLIDELLI